MGCAAASTTAGQSVRCPHGLRAPAGTAANTASNAYQLSAAHERLSSAGHIKASVPHTASDDGRHDATAGLRIAKSASTTDSAATTTATAASAAAATCFTALPSSGSFYVSGSASSSTTICHGTNRIRFIRTHHAAAHRSIGAACVHSTSDRSERVRAAYECQPGSHKPTSNDYPAATTSGTIAGTASSPAITSAYTWPITANAATNACQPNATRSAATPTNAAAANAWKSAISYPSSSPTTSRANELEFPTKSTAEQFAGESTPRFGSLTTTNQWWADAQRQCASNSNVTISGQSTAGRPSQY